ncbi:hypothetical protein [Gordonia sp. N1V]|uniref:hypothetical protein n=1 Tax=Gordonia sp. N1V TaxID=3034163 RepID=UPI0023E0C936|nr:hypothetical protein [Gordonia sp. N1V]MDF3280855.1 hypothetical protein [Gordonia sp. N1V]
MTSTPVFLAPKPIVHVHQHLHVNVDAGISARRWVANWVGPNGLVRICDAFAPIADGGQCVGPNSIFSPQYLELLGTADVEVRIVRDTR